jgi:hypothetical protein
MTSPRRAASLQDTAARTLPYRARQPRGDGKNILVAHGIHCVDRHAPRPPEQEQVLELNIPTGVPIV